MFVGFISILERSKGRWIYSCTPWGPFERALGVVWFIRVRWVHSGALGDARFIWAHSGAAWGSLCSFEHVLEVVGFIQVRSRACCGVSCDGCVHSCVPWEWLGSLWFDGFIPARPVGRWVHSSAPWLSLGSFRFVGYFRARCGVSCDGRVHSYMPWEWSGSLEFDGFIRARPGDRWVHSSAPWGSLVLFGRALGVVGFI